MESYLQANKYIDSDLNLSSHTNLPCENCCFVVYRVRMEKRIWNIKNAICKIYDKKGD